jgi:hypothetical protein
MAIPFLTNVDLNKNQALNLLLQQIAGNHGSPVEGIVWYDSTGKVIKYYDGSTVITLGAAGVGGDASTLDGLDSLYFLARTNHTGSQTASTISDLATVVQAYRLDQFAAPNTSLTLASQKITNLANGTVSSDAINLGQLTTAISDAVSGLSWKDSVRVATTANVALASGGIANGVSIDGVTLATGDRVLVKSQSSGAENGVYVAPASGAASRADDANTAADIQGMAVLVEQGTAAAGTQWTLTTDPPITLGTTALTFAQFGMSVTYTWGGGIGESANTISVAAGNGLTQETDGLALTAPVSVANGGTGAITTAAAKTSLGFTTKASGDIGNGSATQIDFTHSLGTRDVVVLVRQSATPWAQVYPDVEMLDTNNVRLRFAVAPAASAYRVTVVG